MVRVDNVRSHIYGNNITTMFHSKHMGIRYKYVNDYLKDRAVKSIFKFAENNSDILTKNLSAVLHEKHSKK